MLPYTCNCMNGLNSHLTCLMLSPLSIGGTCVKASTRNTAVANSMLALHSIQLGYPSFVPFRNCKQTKHVFYLHVNNDVYTITPFL